MNDRRLEEEREAPDAEEFEVKTGEEEDLDAAMREALEAVERKQGGDGEATGDGSHDPSLAALESDLAVLKDRHVRTLAEFENFRKRVERERAQSRRYEGLPVLSDLLPILDNLGLALDAQGDVEDLKAGVELIAKQFQDLLRRHGVERVEAEGMPFDPTQHDAVSREEDPDVRVATVAEELRPGYRMGDRLVRPASVRVSVPPQVESAEGPDPESLN